MKSHYDTLGVGTSADARQIKRAYFDLVKQFPPERFPEKFREIRTAYDALCDEKKLAAQDEDVKLPEDAVFLYDQAQKARQQGRREHAADIFKMILEIHPELSAIRAEYARSLEVIGKIGKAFDVWADLCAREPDSAVYAAALADCCVVRGWRKKAIVAYKRAIEIDGGDIDCWESLIECHLEGHEYRNAARISARAVDAVREKDSESIYLYTYAAVFGAGHDLQKIEGYLKDIVRMAREGSPGMKAVRDTMLLLLRFIESEELIRFFPYIRTMADTLPSPDDEILAQLSKAERAFEADALKENAGGESGEI